MKTINRLLLAVFTFSILILTGCDDLTTPRFFEAPHDVYTVTGENRVDVYWSHITPAEVDYYRVYWSEDNNKFEFLGNAYTNSYSDLEASNGVKTYYAVTAVAYSDGFESELSKETAYSTPRPQGFNASIFDFITFPNTSGFSFTTFQAMHFLDQNQDGVQADFFLENDVQNGKFYLNVWTDTDIADMGQTDDIHEVDVAPNAGWSQDVVQIDDNLQAKYVEAKVGHTYVINTWDNFYGKIRVLEIRNERIFFDWAFQDSQGNMELEKRNHSIRASQGKLSGEKLNPRR